MLSLNDDDKAAVRAALKAMGDHDTLAAKARAARGYSIACAGGFVAGLLAGWWLL